MIHVFHSEDELISFGASLVPKYKKFLLTGPLGAGKTTLTKGIATGLNIPADNIQSPTYTYIHIYHEKLLHIDLRRVESEEQFLTLGLLDLIEKYEYILIEWPKRTHLYKDNTWLDLSIIVQEDGTRIVSERAT